MKGKNKHNTLQSFKKKFKSRAQQKERLSEKISNALMNNPESDIHIFATDSEHQLREKADIHRARLNRYGRSKINGQTIFLESDGNIYSLSDKGKKQYH